MTSSATVRTSLSSMQSTPICCRTCNASGQALHATVTFPEQDPPGAEEAWDSTKWPILHLAITWHHCWDTCKKPAAGDAILLQLAQ